MGNEQQESETVETTAVETARTVETTTPAPVTTPAGESGADLGKVRDLVLKAHPGVVPDLVRGGSVDELIASVEPARSAYQRIADQVRGSSTETTVNAELGTTVNASGETTVVVQPPVVPAGGATNVADPADLGPTTKIAQALAARKKR
jgi:hypothetical protein